jgi:hypothetical protein
LLLISSVNFLTSHCSNTWQIQFESINPPLDLKLTEEDNHYVLSFYADNTEANFKGYILNFGDTKKESRSKKKIRYDCICGSGCKRDSRENPTDRRRIVFSSLGTSVWDDKCNLSETSKLPPDWNSGSYLSLRALVCDIHNCDSEKFDIGTCIDNFSEKRDDRALLVRCSKASNAIQIP